MGRVPLFLTSLLVVGTLCSQPQVDEGPLTNKDSRRPLVTPPINEDLHPAIGDRPAVPGLTRNVTTNGDNDRELEGELEEQEKEHGKRSIAYSSYRRVIPSARSLSRSRVVYVQPSARAVASRFCDADLLDGEGNVTSVGWPHSYPPGSSCDLRVRRVDSFTCGLILTFHDFDVEGSPGRCDLDWLEVGGRKICGRLPSGTTEFVPFSRRQNDITLRFRSSGYGTGRGFYIDIRRVYGSCEDYNLIPSGRAVPSYAPSCGSLTSSVDGRFTSYGYPGRYTSDLRCEYRIQKNPGYCAVELYFIDFDLEDSDDCTRDYVLLEGERHCGDSLYDCRNVVYFGGLSEIVLPFVTNGYSNHRGFDLRYRQIPCDVKAPNLYKAPVVRQRSRVVPVGRTVLVDTEPRYLLTKPYFAVSPTNSLKQPYCDQRRREWEFYLQSPDYPAGYDDNLDCTIVIERAAADVCELEFTFVKFDVEDDRQCRGDYLAINHGRLCGSLASGTTRRIRFYDSEVIVQFHSDDTVNRAGYEILVRQKTDCSGVALTKVIPTSMARKSYCDEVHTSQDFYIQSVNYPNHYDNYVDCVYTVRKFSPLVCELQLTFLEFDLESDDRCNYDYLDIGGERVCGFVRHGTVRRVRFDNNELMLHFHSDRSTTRTGFQVFAQQRRDCSGSDLSYRVAPVQEVRSLIPAPGLCDSVYRGHTFRLASSDFPNTYSNNLDCLYRVYRESNKVCALELTFHDFELEDDFGCRYDFLDIGGQRLCGTLPKGIVRTVPFLGSELAFHFRSDHSATRQGFDISATQLTECVLPETRLPGPIVVPPLTQLEPSPIYLGSGCNQVYTTWEFYITSPHFPLNYGNGIDCTYKAVRYSVSACAIELHFVSFDVESSSDCSRDYLEAGGDRFCGRITPGTIRRYSLDSPEFVLHFHSDSAQSGTGWYILVRQITQCSANGDYLISRASPVVYKPVVNVIPPQAPKSVLVPVPTVKVFPPPPPVKVIPSPVVKVLPPPPPAVIVPKYEYRDGPHRIATPPPLCDFCLTQPSLQFTSAGYPGGYSDASNCTYRVTRAKDACAVELYFYDFQLSSSIDCSRDYLTVGGKRYCGSELKGQTRLVHFEDATETVFYFVTTTDDPSNKGWWVFYRQVPCGELNTRVELIPGQCDHSFCDELGFIKSPGYPLAQYDSDEDCFYRIKRFRSDTCTVELSFSDFALEPSSDCTRDFLEIDRQRYCGNSLLRRTIYVNFPPGSDDLLMRFRSDSATQDKGFFIQVRQMNYGCSWLPDLQGIAIAPAVSRSIALHKDSQLLGRNEPPGRCRQVLSSPSGEIRSPDYPSDYPPFSDCTYTVYRVSDDVCGLELEFVNFSLETSRLCSYDYLQSPSGDRLCGNSWTGVLRVVSFPRRDDRVTFYFHSDSRVQDRGFHIRYRQITTGCP